MAGKEDFGLRLSGDAYDDVMRILGGLPRVRGTTTLSRDMVASLSDEELIKCAVEEMSRPMASQICRLFQTRSVGVQFDIRAREPEFVYEGDVYLIPPAVHEHLCMLLATLLKEREMRLKFQEVKE